MARFKLWGLTGNLIERSENGRAVIELDNEPGVHWRVRTISEGMVLLTRCKE